MVTRKAKKEVMNGIAVAIGHTRGSAAPAFVKYLCAEKHVVMMISCSAAKPANLV